MRISIPLEWKLYVYIQIYIHTLSALLHRQGLCLCPETGVILVADTYAYDFLFNRTDYDFI